MSLVDDAAEVPGQGLPHPVFQGNRQQTFCLLSRIEMACLAV